MLPCSMDQKRDTGLVRTHQLLIMGYGDICGCEGSIVGEDGVHEYGEIIAALHPPGGLQEVSPSGAACSGR